MSGNCPAESSTCARILYGCHVLNTGPPPVSHEHKQAGQFTFGEVPDLVMPDGYKRSIAAWSAR
jgi:hypothetical protein